LPAHNFPFTFHLSFFTFLEFRCKDNTKNGEFPTYSPSSDKKLFLSLLMRQIVPHISRKQFQFIHEHKPLVIR
jgi:hypothetical protein